MRIFISYRRIDSQEFAGQCFHYFAGQFGGRSVFWDKASINPDEDWAEVISEGVDAADAVLCIVGPRWHSLLQQRLDDANDHVRIELEYAARRQRPVVVVLIDGAAAPNAELLPDSLRYLAVRQAAVFDSGNPAASFRLLDNRLRQFAPQVAAPRAWSQAAVSRRAWVDRGLHTPAQHPSWWQLWNLHDADVMQRVTDVLSEGSAEQGVVLLAGAEDSGRCYLVDAAVRALRGRGAAVHLLRISLDGCETQIEDPLEAYLRYQGQRLGLSAGREKQQKAEIAELCGWLKASLHTGASSINTCASVGMLLELTGSFAAVLRILRSLTLRPGLLERSRLLVCLLEYFAARGRTIVHVAESSVNQFLRDDLISICRFQPRLRLVFSVLPDVDQTYLLGHQSGIRIDVPQFEAAQLQRVLRGKFGGNEVPEWLPRMLSQQTRGSRGLTALQLIELFQDDVLRWDTDDGWCVGEPLQSGAVPVGLSRLLQPLESVFRETPHLESLLRLAALCGELIPMTLLLDFLRIPEAERDELLDVIDLRLCDGVDCVPILADLGYGHPGFCVNRKINVYQFRCSLDAELLVCGTSAEWRQQQAEALLKYLERAELECSRGLASLYLHLHGYLPDGRVQCEALRQRLQWWIHDIEADRFRDHIAKSINSKRISGEAVWLAIQRSGGKESATLRLNLLLAYEQQRDGIPVANQFSFLEKKGLLLEELARYDEAEVCLREGLRICEQTEDPDHPNVATCLNNLANLLSATNRLSEAEPMYRRALSIDESSYGPAHPEVATDLNNLAGLLRATNRLSEAEPLFRRALSIFESSYGPAHPHVAVGLNNLSDLLYDTNRLSEAEPMCRRALSISESSYGPDHPKVATDLNNLALLLRATNRLSEAEPLFRRALSIYESSYGPAHPEVATCLNNLASLLEATNRLSEAEPLYRRALSISESSYGPDHPQVATDLNNLANLLRATNRLSEAEPLFRRALSIFESSYGPDHPHVAVGLNNLASLLEATNRLSEAEPMFRRALSISESSYGPDHPEVANRLNNLASLLEATNRLVEAEPLCRRALSIYESSYGPDHPEVATGLNHLANLLRATNRLSEAEPLYRRALSIFESSYGPAHPRVALGLNNLANLLYATNRHSEAEPLYRRALSIDESSYGPDHPVVATGLNNLAELLRATNRLSEAEPMFRRALSIYESSYGPDHPKVATGLNNLAVLLEATNRLSEAEPLSRRQLEIFVLFTARTGHVHPHLEEARGSYHGILSELGLDAAETESRLRSVLRPLNPD